MDRFYTNIIELLNSIKKEVNEIDRFMETSDPIRRDIYRSTLKNSNKFDPIKNTKGTVDLVPGNQSLYLYRGQHKNFENCDSKLRRSHSNYDERGFISVLKTLELEVVLTKHPAVKDLEKNGYKVSYEGLAQHYGLATNLIDFSSDPHVAAFFACTKCQDGQYLPVESNFGKGHGEFYIANTALLWTPDEKPSFEPIGLQVFPRPEMQKAYGVRGLLKSQAKRCIFNHDIRASKKVYEKFKGGSKLFPFDPLAKKVNEIAESKVFSLNAIILLKDRYPEFKRRIDPFLKRHGIELVSTSIHHFNNEDIKKYKDEWETKGRRKFFSKINSPQIVYSG